MRIIKLFLLVILPVFSWAQNRYDVVIDEIMADPSPQVGLPNNEWIELKNISAVPINLQGWRLNDATGQSGPMPNFILQPDSFVIVCTASAVPAISAFGTTIFVTSFPSLDNNGDQLSLKTPGGKIIHAVLYSDSWYQNELKKDGGWTLEMIDTKNPCGGIDNWKASINSIGGTPGKKNSIDGINTDQMPPRLIRTYAIDSITIIAVFDEPLDSLIASAISNYTIDGGLFISSANALPPVFNMVQLKLPSKMQANTVYNIVVSGVKDCKGNTMAGSNKTKAGLPADASDHDIVINEILFNPRPGDYDFAEFYNRSSKIFDASRIFIANRNSSGMINSIYPLSTTPWLIFPNEYPVVTEDAANLQLNYLVKNPQQVFQLSLPSFPDDRGSVLLLNAQGNIIDEVDYDHRWHFKLIDNEEGVSLERMDPAGASQDTGNWHSAASTAGYATPTDKNSQYKPVDAITATIEITPKIFSPDNDGRDDVATIQYKLNEPGYVANVIVFDARGRSVRHLVKNGTLGLSGHWNWDGLDEKGSRLPIGVYIIYTEIFNLQGRKQHFKNTVVLARMLQ